MESHADSVSILITASTHVVTRAIQVQAIHHAAKATKFLLEAAPATVATAAPSGQGLDSGALLRNYGMGSIVVRRANGKRTWNLPFRVQSSGLGFRGIIPP